MPHRHHKVYDTDPTFSINPITRLIKNETSSKITLIQHDHNSERFTFEIPRFIEEHDMSLCNVVQVHYINIESGNKNQNEDVYDVVDLHISPDDDDKVICSWLISHNATKYVGSLNFVVRFSCVTDGVVDYAWNTAVYSGISVSSGIFNTDIVAEEYSDILAQWKARIEALENGGSGGSGGTSTATVELFNADGNILFVVENGYSITSGSSNFKTQIVCVNTIDPVDGLEVGTRVAKIEIKESENDEYISIASKCASSSTPVVNITNEIISNDYGNVIFLGFAMFGVGQWWQDLADTNIDWHSMRITYYMN